MRMGETDTECAKACVLSHDSAYWLEDGETRVESITAAK